MRPELQAALEAHRAGRIDDAITACRALGDDPDATHFLALLLSEQGAVAEAAEMLMRVRGHLAERADVHVDLARLLTRLKRLEDAEAALRQALLRQDSYVPAWTELGSVLLFQGRLVEAEQAYEKALALLPSEKPALISLGLVRTMLGRFDQALADLERAVSLWPQDASARFHRGLLHLTLGEYEKGWADYAWRKALPGAERFTEDLNLPPWGGERLTRLLVTAEQGYGDSIQCVRFLPQLRAAGISFALRLPEALLPLMRAQAWEVELLSSADPVPPGFTHQVSLMDLPGGLGVRLDRLAPESYLKIESARTADWRRILAADEPVVGLVWHGNAERDLDRLRSARLSDLVSLQQMDGVRFVSLQIGAQAEIADQWPGLLDVTSGLTDFAETAAALSALDAVVSVDTSVAHLAGALGVPCAVLLEKVPDWRYGANGTVSPWYASQYLCRQREIGRWDGAVTEARRRLSALLG